MDSHHDGSLENRNPFYDNCKFFLIFSVVLVHMFSPSRSGETGLTQNMFCNSLCTLIHLYAIPSFFFISGYFATLEISSKFIRNLIGQILIPYIIFEIIYKIAVPKSINTALLFIEPFYLLWFLGMLFLYRLMAPYIAHLRLSTVIVILLACSFFSHLEIDSMVWGSWNFVKYYPYFLIGMWFKKEDIDISRYNFSHLTKLCSLLIIFISFACFFILKIDFLEVIMDSFSMNKLAGLPLVIKEYSVFESLVRDTIFRCLSIILATCFFISIPQKELWVSQYGKNSLYAYLFHPFAMQVLEKNLGFYNHVGTIFLSFLFFLCFFITVILSMDKIAIPCNKLLFYLSEKFLTKLRHPPRK
jgi:fucose 4-O-acetylase-like acetyltransferase